MTGNMIGQTIGNRYLITDYIDVGGMAEVYRAQDNVLGRVVAVKVMLPQYASDPAFTQRFRQEAAAAANLQSPYIVNVYDWGHDGGTYYIVMEFVRGSNLKTAIKQHGAINQRKVAEIGSQVCRALAVAHNQDIIHRDIKPQNIMVQPDGNVKVMDFGIAHPKNSVNEKTSSVLGTAHYISPEQAQGKELTATSDIYSLGVVMYEATTGQLPFDAPDAVSVAMMQVQDTPAPPSEINPNIDPDLEAIIMKAMEKRPVDRFQTASEMRLAINDYLAGRPVNIGGSFSSAQTTVLPGPSMGGVRAGGDSTQVLPATSSLQNGMSGGMNPIDPTMQYRAKEEEKKSNAGKIVAGAVVGIIIIAAIVFGFASGLFGGGSGDPVPNVVGMTQEDATKTLKDSGFEVGNVSSRYDADVPEGQVLSQDPAAEQKRPAGTKVNLVISQGVEQVKVPDLTNKTPEQAQQELEKAGLTARAGAADYSTDVDEGKVMGQSPVAGETVAKGSAVEYYLSLGTQDIEIPSVVNYSQSDAIKTLENSGFQVSVESEYNSNYDSGTVYRQDPSSGKLEKGSTVTIYVSKGPDPANQPKEIPYVVGYTVDKALSTLQNAGFDVYVAGNDWGTSIVTAQNPTGSAKPGTTITITGEAPSSGGSDSGGSSSGDGKSDD